MILPVMIGAVVLLTALFVFILCMSASGGILRESRARTRR